MSFWRGRRLYRCECFIRIAAAGAVARGLACRPSLVGCCGLLLRYPLGSQAIQGGQMLRLEGLLRPRRAKCRRAKRALPRASNVEAHADGMSDAHVLTPFGSNPRC